jgi:hypothetical protein
VTLFTPLSTVASSANQIFAIDNDTGNVFWSRQFEGALGSGLLLGLDLRRGLCGLAADGGGLGEGDAGGGEEDCGKCGAIHGGPF